MSQTQLDLRELALERPKPGPTTTRRRPPWLTRYVVPIGVLVGFIVLLVIAAGDQWLPRERVTVVPVIVMRVEAQQEGTPLFQAAGWVEPRPTPINVPALTEGVVEKLFVVEGAEVHAGMPVAKLIDIDARLALRQAETLRDLRQAEVESMEAELNAAQLRFDNPVHLEASLADAESLLAKIQTDIAQLPFSIQAAEAKLEFARQNLEGRQAAKDALAVRLIQEAQSEYAKASSELRGLRERGPRLEREAQVLGDKVTALSTQLRLLIEESRQLGDAKARVKAAEARLEEAELAVEKAQLAVDRTVVRAPINGRVLTLIAPPGTRVMGLESAASQSSSTVVSLYDPQMLQVRADVRLEDVPMVQPGQLVEIKTPSSKESIRGKVLMPTSTANIQKNTLEVKVSIENPPSAIRPEMLVTATFLAPPRSDSEQEQRQDSEHMLVPKQLILTEDDSAAIWIVDPEGHARRVAVRLGKAGTNELVEVVEGLRPTDKLITSSTASLEPGTRVEIASEDPSIGLSGRL